MTARLVLEKEQEDSTSGTVKPLVIVDGEVYQGLSVGVWSIGEDNRIHIDLMKDLETIIHEIATRKSVRAELRATEKWLKGEQRYPTIEYDPTTKRFKQV